MKSILLTSAAALLGTALVTQSDAPSAIKNHVATLKAAKSFKADIVVRKIAGGTPDKETLVYSKDGMFKIDTPTSLTVSDGKLVWKLDKKANTYTEAPASLARTKESDVWAWAAFFSEDIFKGAKEFNAKGTLKLPGGSATEYQIKLADDKELSLYIDAQSGVARGLSNKDFLIVAPTISIGKEAIDAKEFTFTPPAGAKKEEIKPSAASFADVQAILKTSCSGCHNDGNRKAGLSVESYDSIMKKVVAGDASSSALYQSVSGPKPRMPRGGAPLSQKDQDTIAAWINGGAKNE